jgi:hypothetical protein
MLGCGSPGVWQEKEGWLIVTQPQSGDVPIALATLPIV